MNKLYLKGVGFVSLLLSIGLLSMFLFTFSNWLKNQNEQQNKQYQQLQAMQIAENQIALRMANKPCATLIKQNELDFYIDCYKNKIKIRYPLGEFSIEK